MGLLTWIERVLSVVLGALVAGMMFLTFADVVGREAFLNPLIVAPELTTIGLALMVYIGLPVVSARNEHITISLFETLFKGRSQRIKLALVSALMALLSAVLSYQLWIHAGKLDNEVMMFLQFKKQYLAYTMSILSLGMAVVFAVRARLNLSSPEALANHDNG